MDREERVRRQKEFLIKVGYWTVWGLAAFLLIKFVGPVLFPFLIALLIAWALSIPVSYLAGKMHIRRSLVAVLLVFLFYMGIGVLLYIAGNSIVGLIQNVFNQLTSFLSGTLFPMLEEFCGWLGDLTLGLHQAVRGAEKQGTGANIPAVDMERAGSVLSGLSGKAIDCVSGLAAFLPGLFMKIMIAVIATVFMELEFDEIKAFLDRQIPEKWKKSVADGKAYCMGTLGKCVLSYLIIMGITFAELLVGFLLLKINGAVVMALLIAVMDILPVLGTGTILLPWAVIACTTGNLRMGIGILVLYVVITVVRNIIEPKLVGKQMGLSPVVMLPSMLLGLHFFGILGLFLVPFGVAVLKSLNDRGIIHIIKHQ